LVPRGPVLLLVVVLWPQQRRSPRLAHHRQELAAALLARLAACQAQGLSGSLAGTPSLAARRLSRPRLAASAP